VEQRHIDRIRNTKFPVARRGYDQREVDNFMLELADWLESRAAEEIGSFAVKRKLEMVGRTTAYILTTTQAEAEELRKTAEGEAAAVAERAEAGARKTRETAEEFANEVRENAKRQAEEKVSAAADQARSTVEEGKQRRAGLESEIAELEALRDRVLADVERLGKDLEAAVGAHRATDAPDLADALGSTDEGRPRERQRTRRAKASAEPERSK